MSIRLDLVKAVERDSLHVLWEAGKQPKFNAGVLAVVCSYFAMARRLIVGDSVSSATSTVGTIIAGSKFPVCFLRLVIQSTHRKNFEVGKLKISSFFFLTSDTNALTS